MASETNVSETKLPETKLPETKLPDAYPVTSTVYDDRLKIECLYNVLHEYSYLLRPGVYVNDNKLCLLFAMCRMIDRSNALRKDERQSPVSSSSVEFDAWKLENLQKDWDDFFVDTNTAASPSTRGISITDRMDVFESMVLRQAYF